MISSRRFRAQQLRLARWDGIQRTAIFLLGVFASLVGIDAVVWSITSDWFSFAIANLGVIVIVQGAALYLLWGDSRRSYDDSRRYVAFVYPESEPFYQSLFFKLNEAFEHVRKFDVALVPVHGSFDGEDAYDRLKAFEDAGIEWDAVVYIAPDPEDRHLFQQIKKIQQSPDYILLLADVYCVVDEAEEEWLNRLHWESLPHFVGHDEREGGRLAAEMAIEYIREVGIAEPRVMIFKGGIARWEEQRWESFKKVLLSHELFADGALIESEDLRSSDYKGEDSYESMTKWLSSQAAKGESSDTCHLDLVFACNDDMALGIRRALKYHSEKKQITFRNDHLKTSPAGHHPKVIGYDGIEEFTNYLNHDDEYLLGTIDVDLDQQAKKIQRTLCQLMLNPRRQREDTREEKELLVPPKPITPTRD